MRKDDGRKLSHATLVLAGVRTRVNLELGANWPEASLTTSSAGYADGEPCGQSIKTADQ